MIIGVSGKMGVGKTTLANVARDNFNFTVKSFAAELKEEVMWWMINNEIHFLPSNFYGTQGEKASFINIPISAVTEEMRKHGFLTYNRIHGVFTAPTSTRAIMQWWGTEYRRAQNPDYWIEKMMSHVEDEELVIIDDIRYLNEADMVKIFGGALIRVNRYVEYPSTVKANHLSEVALDNYDQFKVTVHNNGISIYQYESLCIEAIKYIMQTVV